MNTAVHTLRTTPYGTGSGLLVEPAGDGLPGLAAVALPWPEEQP